MKVKLLLGACLAALLLVGADNMLIPALCVIVAGLLLLRPVLDRETGWTKGGSAGA